MRHKHRHKHKHKHNTTSISYGRTKAILRSKYVRFFETRKKDHLRNVKQNTAGSNIAKHSWTNDHIINFEDGQVIGMSYCRTRKTLKSWHTVITAESDNNSKQLPEQYRLLPNKI